MHYASPRRFRAFDATGLTFKAWRFVEQEMQDLGTPLDEVMPGFRVQGTKVIHEERAKPAKPETAAVLEFSDATDSSPSSPPQRLAIIEQAELLFQLYPHMPFKTDRFHFVHPQVYLNNARGEVETATET